MLSTLSGGERKRVFLVRLLISNPNFLILDEPTNDFDIFTMNILEDFLLGYRGCLLLVSHDRYFMDKIADTMFIMEDDGSISGFVGKCSEYIQYLEETEKEKRKNDGENLTNDSFKKNIKSDSETSDRSLFHFHSTVQNSPLNNAQNSSTSSKQKPRKKTFKEQKEFESLENEIMELEEKKSALETEMASSDFKIAQKAGEEYKFVEEKLAADYARWEELAELG